MPTADNALSIERRPLRVKGEVSFCRDVVTGLRSQPKYLHSKYFYDLELGPGDCTKSVHLLRELMRRKVNMKYLPIDISANIIDYLTTHLPSEIPGIKVEGLRGEYFRMLEQAAQHSHRRKVVLFLGSNLGNMFPEDAATFCIRLRSHLQPGDLAIIGIDLKKHPSTILAAYNDRDKITREFNLNLLRRINRELKANFDLTKFDHFPVYDPASGGCRSFLISLVDQFVTITTKNGPIIISFKENEEIFMEISQKYTFEEMNSLGAQASFRTLKNIFDRKSWFMDSIWEAV
jgi:L-histidine N-alpha-methyltransferase